jgi:hypothetical protein
VTPQVMCARTPLPRKAVTRKVSIPALASPQGFLIPTGSSLPRRVITTRLRKGFPRQSCPSRWDCDSTRALLAVDTVYGGTWNTSVRSNGSSTYRDPFLLSEEKYKRTFRRMLRASTRVAMSAGGAGKPAISSCVEIRSATRVGIGYR